MKRKTEIMQSAIRRALTELRKRRGWSQAELARQMIIHSSRVGVALDPSKQEISGWEHGKHAPSPECRMVLARIAASHKRTEELALFFSYWNHVVHVHDRGWLQDDNAPWPPRPFRRGRAGRRAPIAVGAKGGRVQ